MGLKDFLFGDNTSKAQQAFEWNLLTETPQIEQILADSELKPILLFKHSTRCGISSTVLRRLEVQLSGIENLDFYLLDILKYRSISNLVAERFGVMHQSPQVIMVEKKEAVKTASHYDILNLFD